MSERDKPPKPMRRFDGRNRLAVRAKSLRLSSQICGEVLSATVVIVFAPHFALALKITG